MIGRRCRRIMRRKKEKYYLHRSKDILRFSMRGRIARCTMMKCDVGYTMIEYHEMANDMLVVTRKLFALSGTFNISSNIGLERRKMGHQTC